MRGHSDPVDFHEDIPSNAAEEQRIQAVVSEARDRLRELSGRQSLRAYVFTVETARDDSDEVSESLKELHGLLEALGDSCVGETKQRLARIFPPTLVGSGKAAEIGRSARQAGADYVVCDRDLSHSQVRNLETIIRLPVLDRASIILQIFERHARTREARIQVGIAHLEYLLPRLASSWISSDRQGGGSSGGGAARSRGAGESKAELSQRHVRERLERLRTELDSIQQDRTVQRKARQGEFRVALVGYTNAGKTTLMNALTGSRLSTRNGVFETLDATVRRLAGQGDPKVLVSDTVGFIRNLPHTLVASFRSTLQDACEADLLLHVVDASDPHCEAHMRVTDEVLAEIGAGDVPRLVVFNKADRVPEGFTPQVPPGTDHVMVSALNPEDVERCSACILAIRRRGCEEHEVHIPYERAHELGDIYALTEVLSRKDDDDGIHLRIAAEPSMLARLKKEKR